MKIVKVKFLGKEYDIRCKEDEVAKIRNLELKLNNRVRQFSKKNQNFTDTHKLLIATLSLEDQVNDLLLRKKILQTSHTKFNFHKRYCSLHWKHYINYLEQ